VPGFASRLKVPVLVFAAGKNSSRTDCCSTELDSKLAAAATEAGKQFQLIVYPDSDLDFVNGGEHANPRDYSDSFKRAAEMIQVYLSK
jgi:dienelactone hydrolase